MKKWLTSSNEEYWVDCETYPNRETALKAAQENGDSYIGRQAIPQFKINADTFIRSVLDSNEDQFFDHDSCYEWPQATSKQQKELSKLLEDAFNGWLKKHKLEPRWFIVENIEFVQTAEVAESRQP